MPRYGWVTFTNKLPRISAHYCLVWPESWLNRCAGSRTGTPRNPLPIPGTWLSEKMATHDVQQRTRQATGTTKIGVHSSVLSRFAFLFHNYTEYPDWTRFVGKTEHASPNYNCKIANVDTGTFSVPEGWGGASEKEAGRKPNVVLS